MTDAIEALSTKVGLVIVILGFMHFFNMFILMRFRRSALFRAFDNRQPMAFPQYYAPAVAPNFPPMPMPQPQPQA